jgi:hypothetical protein
MVNCLCFGVEDEIEDGGDDCQEHEGQEPSEHESGYSMSIGIVDVLPDDFFGLGGAFNLDVEPFNAKMLEDYVVFHFLKFVDNFILLVFRTEDNYCFIADGSIALDLLHFFLVLLLHEVLSFEYLPIEFIQPPLLLAAVGFVDPILLLLYQFQFLLLEFEEILKGVQDDNFLDVEFPPLESLLQKIPDFGYAPLFLRQIHEDDCIVRNERVPLLVVLQGFMDGIPDID